MHIHTEAKPTVGTRDITNICGGVSVGSRKERLSTSDVLGASVYIQEVSYFLFIFIYCCWVMLLDMTCNSQPAGTLGFKLTESATGCVLCDDETSGCGWSLISWNVGEFIVATVAHQWDVECLQMRRRLILKNEGFISRSFLEVGNVTSEHQIALSFFFFLNLISGAGFDIFSAVSFHLQTKCKAAWFSVMFPFATVF